MPAVKFHPNAPPRLIKAYKKAGSYHKCADMIEVNVAHVHNLITKGIEPSDRTDTGREIRSRLFLPRHKRKKGPRKPPQPKPDHIRWWSRQDRESLIKQLYDLNKEQMP